jgi:hypothetical membrane protein
MTTDPAPTPPPAPVGSSPAPAPAPTPTIGAREVVGAVLWSAVAQYFVVLLVVQAAWTIPYSIVMHTISDLGAVGCGGFESRDVCSPWHVTANVSWTITGLSIFLGAVLLWRLLARDGASRTGLALVAVAGLGELVVGLSPEDASARHIPAAVVAIVCGLTGITVLGAALLRRAEWRGTGWLGLALGAFGIVALLLGATVAPHRVIGLFERMAVYPILVWVVLAGVTVLRRARADRSAHRGTDRA